MLQVEFTPLEIDEASLAFGAHEEVGHGGHFLGAAAHHGAVPDVLLPAAAVLDRQLRAVAASTAARTPPPGRGEICAKTLEEYEQPPLDDAIRAELEEYVTRRRAELGD